MWNGLFKICLKSPPKPLQSQRNGTESNMCFIVSRVLGVHFASGGKFLYRDTFIKNGGKENRTYKVL